VSLVWILSKDYQNLAPSTVRILVVIDKFTKYGHFIPLTHPYTALTVAQKFVDTIYKLHGLPSMIISDRDLVFTSKV
jgi:hypothetical protein